MVRATLRRVVIAVVCGTALGAVKASAQTGTWEVTLPPSLQVDYRVLVHAGAAFAVTGDGEAGRDLDLLVTDEYGVTLARDFANDEDASVQIAATGRSRTLHLTVMNASPQTNRVALRVSGSEGPSDRERADAALRLESLQLESLYRQAQQDDALRRQVEAAARAREEAARATAAARAEADRAARAEADPAREEAARAASAARAEADRAAADRAAVARAEVDRAAARAEMARASAPASSGHAVVPVFFATDRSRAAGSVPSYGKGRNPGGALALGRIDVSVPRDGRHVTGRVERPTWWTLYTENPNEHFTIVARRQQSGTDFYADLRNKVTSANRREMFVFVHGFNVGFDDAVFRTAQIAYDLGFDGAPVLYSWPSEESVSPAGYATDLANNDWTVPHLAAFLDELVAKSGASKIHIIAHSMGNRALVNAMTRLPSATRTRFSQVLLTAPDIDADTFVELADAVKRNSERTTLYVSANDWALAASRKLQTYTRAGDTSQRVVVVPGIDTVDVSAIDTNLIGHSYYGDNRSVISDMVLVLTQGLPPMLRPRIKAAGRPPSAFWRITP